MGKTQNSGLGIGIGTSPQGSIIQIEFDKKVANLLSKEPKKFDSSKLTYIESKQKYEEYLLNPDHIYGGSKAKFLKEVLGYEKGDEIKLHNAISEALNGKIPNKVIHTEFGTKYEFNVKLKGKDNKFYPANVVIVVQNDKNKINYRLITLIPGKKDK